MQISVSFLKSIHDQKTTINLIDNTDANYIHVDVMDGIFVDNKTLSIEECTDLFSEVNKPLDVHLMVKNPLPYINYFKNLNPSFVTIHVEIDECNEMIDLIKSYGIKAGLAINPETNEQILDKYFDKVDLINVMSVHPGKGGQEFMLDSIDKINYIKNNSNLLIEVDGGVNDISRKYLNDVSILVSGSYICMSDNYQEKINSLR